MRFGEILFFLVLLYCESVLTLHIQSTDSIMIMCHSLEVVLEGLLKEGPCNGGPPELQSVREGTHILRSRPPKDTVETPCGC